MVVTVYTRAGEAFAQGAPVGASVTIGKSVSSQQQARLAGSAFGAQATNAFGLPTQETLLRERAAERTARGQAPVADRWDAANQWVQSRVADPLNAAASWTLRALNYPVEKTGDLVEALSRGGSQAQARGDYSPWGAFTNFGENWAATQQAQSSPMQTLWEHYRNHGEDDQFALLDDPTRRAERDEYFGSGASKWVTGIGDAAFNIFADPTVLAGAGVSKLRKAADAVKATDVAAASRGVENLTVGGRRVNATVNRLVDASETIRSSTAAGGYADMASSKFMQQTADAGAIPYFMKRLDDVADDTERVGLKRDALFAGMGDRDALARLEAKQADLALELESFNSPNRATAVAGLLGRKDFSHLENLRAVDEDAFLDKVVASHTEEIRDTIAAIDRVHELGSSGLRGDALQGTQGVGELASLAGARKAARVSRTIHRGAGLPPVHVLDLTGRHVPGMFRLSGDDAFESFNASLSEMRRIFKGTAADRVAGEMADDFALAMGSADPGAARAARKGVVDRFHKVMETNLARRHSGGDAQVEQQIRSLIRQIRSNRTAEMAHIRERSYRANATDGVAYTQTEDGVLVWKSDDMKREMGTPVDASQFEDMVSIPEYSKIERAIKTHLAGQNGGLSGFMAKSRDGAWSMTEAGLAAFNDLWKFSALFRIGYPIRNQVDTQARLIATMGALRWGQYFAQGLGNWAYNLKKVPSFLVEDAARKAQARVRLEQLGDMGDNLTDALRVEKADLERLVASKPVVRTADGAEVPVSALRGKSVNGVPVEFVRRRGTHLARYVGLGGRGAAYQSVGEMGRAMTLLDARESTLALMTDAHRSTLSELRKSQHVQQVAGSNPLWAGAYRDMVNKHVRASSPMMQLLAGADDATVAAWYRTDAAGRAQWEGFARSGRYESPEELVAVQRAQLDTLLPEGRPRSLAMGGDLTDAQVEEMWRGQKRPAVPAEMLERADVNPLVAGYNQTRSTWFKWASEVPENMLGRHPFYVARKEAHLERAIANAGGDADALTLQQYNRLAQRASAQARRDVGAYLFDTSQRSNLAHHLRFLSPFYSAWSDTMRKWSRIAGENLGVAPLIPKAFMAPNSALTVVDEDGNRILRNGDVVNAEGEVIRTSADWTEGHILFPVPEWLPSWANPGGGDTVKVSKGSLNVIFQGEPWFLPGPGVLATIPANQVALRAFPEAVDDATPSGAILRYLMPFGLDDDPVVEQTMPMWAKNLKTLIAGEGDTRFAQTYAMLMAEEQNAVRRGESQPRSQAELDELITRRTRNWWMLRVMGSQAPFSTQPTSRLAFYRQEWQRYQREFGPKARDRFYEGYPDYFEMAISLSANEAGITATDESWADTAKYMGEIKANPQFGWMWVGAANLSPGFDQGVYTAQRFTGLRGSKDPGEAFNELQVNKGWYDYQKVAGALELKLQERRDAGGSASITAKSNADLKEIRDAYITELKAENVQWANAYDKGAGGKSAMEFLRAAAQAVQDRPELMDRGDFQALEEYMEVRGVLQAKLAERVAAGGSASLDAQSNADLREIWDEYTSELRGRDLGFDQMYTRGGLDRDDLTGG